MNPPEEMRKEIGNLRERTATLEQAVRDIRKDVTDNTKALRALDSSIDNKRESDRLERKRDRWTFIMAVIASTSVGVAVLAILLS